MMRLQILVSVFLAFVVCTGHAQKIEPTQKVAVTGAVERALEIDVSKILSYPTHGIGDLLITSHNGEPRGTKKNLKGVLVKDMLAELPLKVDSPKELSEFYLVFVASDGYKVVFSWNELFNSPTGEHAFIVTEENGVSIDKMEDRILMVVDSDLRTGSRHVKSLSKIIVGRAQ
ncbi:MAG: molybdopterin-binding protein [Bacteroidia bacterium]|nr:molybdopterin-binding protein [Bacteroidia bacterium]